MPSKKGAISQGIKKILYDGFFTVGEIETIANMETPDGIFQEVDINGDLWKAVRKRRMNEVNDLRSKGFNDVQIRSMIGRITKLKDAPTPFDFLKAEYIPAVKTKDYKEKVKSIKEKINKAFSGVTGGKYFRPVAIKNSKYNPVRKPILPKKRSR